MQPDAVAEFISAFTSIANAERDGEAEMRQRLGLDLKKAEQRLQGLYDAIADWFRTPGLLEQLEDLEAHKIELKAKLSAPSPAPVRIHPGLATLYRKRVEDLSAALQDASIRTPALEILRGLIERVTVSQGSAKGDVTIELEGAIVAMIEGALGGSGSEFDAGSVKVVAGVGFEPTTFRL